LRGFNEFFREIFREPFNFNGGSQPDIHRPGGCLRGEKRVFFFLDIHGGWPVS
jgi:hypothetical protein